MFPSETIKLYTLVLLPCFIAIDSLIMYAILKKKYINNFWYFNWYRKLGFFKMTIIKTVFLIIQVYSFFSPPMRRSDPALASWFYFLLVFIIFLKFRNRKDSGRP